MDKNLYALKSKQYEDGVTLITCTGDRQICFAREEFYIKRQTYNGPLQWLVADDGQTVTKVTMGQELVKNPNKDTTLNKNLQSVLPLIKYNNVLIVEDDDWYAPNYINIYLSRLKRYQLVGEGARYYNVATRSYRIWENGKHASFCQTGFRAEILDKLYVSSLRNSPFIDKRLWSKDATKFVYQDVIHCVGIKGMPGRKGIGMGHRPNGSFIKDPDLKELVKWIGEEDTEWYRKYYRKGI